MYQDKIEILPSMINVKGGSITSYGGQANHITDATTNIPQAAAAPTKAEFDALVAAYNSLATKFNTLLSAVEGVGILKLT